MADKKTKRDFYNEIIAMENASEELKAFAKNEIALLDKKNANRKPSAEQKANEAFKDDILEVLAKNPGGMTASDIRKEIPALAEAGEVQKTSSLLKQLVDAKLVRKDTSGKKTLFFLDNGDEPVEE